MTLPRRTDTPENRAFWSRVDAAAEYVRSIAARVAARRVGVVTPFRERLDWTIYALANEKARMQALPDISEHERAWQKAAVEMLEKAQADLESLRRGGWPEEFGVPHVRLEDEE